MKDPLINEIAHLLKTRSIERIRKEYADRGFGEEEIDNIVREFIRGFDQGLLPPVEEPNLSEAKFTNSPLLINFRTRNGSKRRPA